MICLIALVVFGILGVFSATHRKIALESFECVFKRIRLKPCDSGLDKRLKSQITGRLMRRNPKLARFTYRHFEAISWLFTILMVVSIIYSGIGIYKFVMYGNCYGPESEAFCLLGGFTETTSKFSSNYSGPIIFPDTDNDPSIGPENASVIIIEFGCFMCPYTLKARPIIKQILNEYKGKVRYVYRDFPLNEKHAKADWHAEAANCALEQGKYWNYHDKLFEIQQTCMKESDHIAMLRRIAAELNLNITSFNICLDSRKYQEEVINDFWDGIKAGVHGTPVFFINNRTITGPKPFAAFKKIIDEELKK